MEPGTITMCQSNPQLRQRALDGANGSPFNNGKRGGFAGGVLGLMTGLKSQAGQNKNSTGNDFTDFITRDNPEIRKQINAATPSKQRTSGNSGLSIRSSSSTQSAPKATSGGSRSAGRKRFNTS